jgi:hypothetical protein
MALQAEISGEYFNIHYIYVKNTDKYPVLQYQYRIGHMDPHLKIMCPDPTFAAFYMHFCKCRFYLDQCCGAENISFGSGSG